MTLTATAINIIRYSQCLADCEGFVISLSFASERSLACRLPSLLTAVAVLLLSAVVAWRLMPLTLIFDFTTRGSAPPAPERSEELLVRFLSAQGSEPLMDEAVSICLVLSSASDTCGTDSCVNTMLSIWSTMFWRNLSVVEEVADCDTACCTAMSAFSSTTRFVLRHEVRKSGANTKRMATARLLYSLRASKQGQGFEEKSLCP